MTERKKILAFAGSTRTASYNKKLLQVAVGGARAAGAEVTVVDLRDYPLPLYDGDLEERDGLPANARELKALLREHAGFLIASPEYNSSITGVLKNAIDWASRREGDEPRLVAFRGKTAALVSASPGGLGGLRALRHVREILGNIGVLVIPEQRAVSRAHEAFADDGSLKDADTRAAVERVGARLAEVVGRLAESE